MSFYEFMIGYKRDNPIGDLASDVRQDEEFPRDKCISKKEFRRYLEKRGACDNALTAFDKAWAAYRRSNLYEKDLLSLITEPKGYDLDKETLYVVPCPHKHCEDQFYLPLPKGAAIAPSEIEGLIHRTADHARDGRLAYHG